MFCSQKKSVLGLGVEQALSLVLTSAVSFGSCRGPGQPQGPPGRAGLCWRPAQLGTAAQLWLSCGGGAVWDMAGGAPGLGCCPHVPRASPSQDCCVPLSRILIPGLLLLPWAQPCLTPGLALWSWDWPGQASLAPCLPQTLPISVPLSGCLSFWLSVSSPSQLISSVCWSGHCPFPLAPCFPSWSGDAGPWHLVLLQFSLLWKALSWHFGISSSQ